MSQEDVKPDEGKLEARTSGEDAKEAPNGAASAPRYNDAGIELLPKPSSDPRDPLRWPLAKKITIYAVMCFGTFVGIATAAGNILATTVQSKDWGVTPEEAAYTVSAVLAGIVVGPIIFVAAVRAVGVMSCCFWSEVALVACSIWSAVSTGPRGYNSFIAARVVAGLFSPTVQVFTTGVIANMFYVHQRGKALAIYSTIYLIANVAGPTFSAFIVEYVEWPVCFWWATGANALAAALIFVFGEDTTWDRVNDRPLSQTELPAAWGKRRWALFFPGSRVAAPGTVKNITSSYSALGRIAISPITLLAGLYTLINYSWFIMAGVQTPIILQEPPAEAGFGFSPQSTGYFYFAAWIGAVVGVGYGVVLNDRLPQWLRRRHRGVWHPEYRLHTAWFPGIVVMPGGLGLFGAGVTYRLHFMALAVGLAMITFGATASIPPATNYVIEVFKSHPQEVGAVLNAYRIAFALTIQFFFLQWIAATGVNWAFGTAAFITLVVACGFVAVLVWQGRRLRAWSLLPDEARAEEEEQEARGGGSDSPEKA